MQKIKFIIFPITFSFLISCKESKPTDDYKGSLDSALQCRLEQQKTESFVVPDSINKTLIVAVYYDVHSKCHSLIVFNDTIKKTATQVQYLSDSTATIDKLITIKFNEFTSVFNKGLYVVKENAVAYTYINGNQSVSFEYPRTDKN